MELNDSEKVALLGDFEIDFEYIVAEYIKNFNRFIIFNKENPTLNLFF